MSDSTGTIFVVETTEDEGRTQSLQALNAMPGIWKLIHRFVGGEGERREAHASALSIRDGGRHTTGARPVVRVRSIEPTDGGRVSRVEIIMQRLCYRQRKSA